MPTVTLKVVGFYFEKSVTLPTLNGVSVADVMDEVKKATLNDLANDATASTFDYRADEKGFLSFIRIAHRQFVKSSKKGYNHKTNAFEQRDYPPGVYAFNDNSPEARALNPQPVWQYYILRNEKDGTRSNIAADAFEVPFTKTLTLGASAPKYTLQDGDKIVWRLIGICTAPTGDNLDAKGRV